MELLRAGLGGSAPGKGTRTGGSHSSFGQHGVWLLLLHFQNHLFGCRWQSAEGECLQCFKELMFI